MIEWLSGETAELLTSCRADRGLDDGVGQFCPGFCPSYVLCRVFVTRVKPRCLYLATVGATVMVPETVLPAIL
jgi:hypothetical protein